VVIIITVVTQEEADRDIPKLIALKDKYPWMRIGLSMEPLLEDVDISQWLFPFKVCANCPCPDPSKDRKGFEECCREPEMQPSPLDWVIVGGESGGHARPMNAAWAIEIKRQCDAANTPFHFKQYGEFLTFDKGYPGLIRDEKTGGIRGVRVDGIRYPVSDCYVWPDRTFSVRVGKNRTGRLLDGVLHDAGPREIRL
jgi:hypothetical protein